MYEDAPALKVEEDDEKQNKRVLPSVKFTHLQDGNLGYFVPGALGLKDSKARLQPVPKQGKDGALEVELHYKGERV